MSQSSPDSSAAPAWMQALGHPQTDRRLEVLRGIARSGSISQSARDVGVSYKAAWQAIDTLTNLAGVALVEKSVGGAGGGGARLTAAGQELLTAADALTQVRGAVMQQLRAPAAVQRLGVQTSMRNQWPCVVQQVQVAGPLALVQLRSQHAELELTARITAESAQLLGLQAGWPVLALCKATAVQVQAGQQLAQTGPTPNAWDGKVTRVAIGAIGDEVAVQTTAGVQLVGFAAAGSGLRVGHKVVVQVPESAVVLALLA